MKILAAIVLALAPQLCFGITPQSPPASKGEYFGQPKPGPRAERFALPVPTNRPDHHVRAVTFSPDGDEAYWPVIDTQDGYKRWIVVSVIENGTWTKPRIAPFSNKDYFDDVPFLPPSGNQLFFLSGRPLEAGGKVDKERIWRMTREGGSWSEPVPLPGTVNDAYGIHQQVSLDRENHLYFAGEGDEGYGSLDIYCARHVDGEYQKPVNLGPAINGPEGDYAPTVSPDGSYLIFTRNAGDGWTLFITFKTPAGAWTSPLDLTAHLPGVEGPNLSGSFVTADGNYLVFFDERDQAAIPYWIDTSFIDALRDAN